MSTARTRRAAPSSRRLARPSSGRYGANRRGAADDQGEAEEGEIDSGRSRRGNGGGSNIKLYVALALVILVLIGAFSFRPVMCSIYLNRLDKATGAGALAAANDFLTFVDKDPEHVRYAIVTNRGPVEAQIYMAQQCKSFAAAVSIANRRVPAPTPVELKATLEAAFALYDPGRNKTDPLPSSLGDWARKNPDRDVAVAAIHLLAKGADNLNAKNAIEVLRDVAVVPDQDPVKLTAALDGLAMVTNTTNFGYSLKVLSGNAADQVMLHQPLKDAIVAAATPSHIDELLSLLSHPLPGVRAVALNALGGPGMNLPFQPEYDQRRQDIGEKIAGKLAPETPPVEIVAALHAVKGMRLIGAREAVVKLVPLAPGLNLEGVTPAYLSEILGKSLIFEKGDIARPASEDLIKKLVAGLDDPASRTVVADALGMIHDRTFLALRPALDKLAALGEDPACFNALTSLVNAAFSRNDVVKVNGSDLGKWREFLAKDRPRFDRYCEIKIWYGQNLQYQRVTDGRKRLGDNKKFIDEASEQLDGWLEDPKFVPPMGLVADDVRYLARDIKELGVSVRKAFSGAD